MTALLGLSIGIFCCLFILYYLAVVWDFFNDEYTEKKEFLLSLIPFQRWAIAMKEVVIDIKDRWDSMD